MELVAWMWRLRLPPGVSHYALKQTQTLALLTPRERITQETARMIHTTQ